MIYAFFFIIISAFKLKKMTTTTALNTASNTTSNTTTKRFTRDEIMAMARYEYARQLCIYTKAQLKRGTTTNNSNKNPSSVNNATLIY
jgi:hypothetical protein